MILATNLRCKMSTKALLLILQVRNLGSGWDPSSPCKKVVEQIKLCALSMLHTAVRYVCIHTYQRNADILSFVTVREVQKQQT